MNEIFDKAKYHLEGDFPSDLAPAQAYVVGGHFFAWLARHDMLSDSLRSDFAGEIRKMLTKQGSPCDLYKAVGGVLDSDSLSPEGATFSRAYFDFDHGEYLNDFIAILASNEDTAYHASDDWNAYDRLERRIDERYKRWISDGRPLTH